MAPLVKAASNAAAGSATSKSPGHPSNAWHAAVINVPIAVLAPAESAPKCPTSDADRSSPYFEASRSRYAFAHRAAHHSKSPKTSPDTRSACGVQAFAAQAARNPSSVELTPTTGSPAATAPAGTAAEATIISLGMGSSSSLSVSVSMKPVTNTNQCICSEQMAQFDMSIAAAAFTCASRPADAVPTIPSNLVSTCGAARRPKYATCVN